MSFNFQSPFREKIGCSAVPGVTPVRLLGVNAGITTTFETAWDNSNAYAFLAANMASPTIVSSSANDAAAGTGARTVRVTGVDSLYAIQTEVVTLNGVTPVALVNNYMSINDITVLTAGSGGVKAGTLTLAAGGTTHAFMAVGINTNTSYIYTVPAGYGLMIENLTCSLGASTTAGAGQIILESTTDSVGASGLKTRRYHSTGIQTTGTMLTYVDFKIPMRFAPKTQLQAQILVSAGPTLGIAYSDAFLYKIDSTVQDYFV